MELRFPSGGNLLAAHLARPPMRADAVDAPAVVLAHGYPSEVSATAVASSALPELADRLAGGDGLAGHGPGLPRVRRLGGQLLAGRLARRPRRRGPLPAGQRTRHGRVAGRLRHGRRARAVCGGRRPRRSEASQPSVRPPTSTTGRRIPSGCSSTRGRSASSRTQRSPPMSTPGPASSASCERWPARRRSPHARSSSSTGATTTSFPCSTRASWSTPTATPSSAS